VSAYAKSKLSLILIPVLIAALQALALEAITQPVSNMLNQILGAVPALFGAALVLAIAYILGKVIAELVANLLSAIGFDSVLVWLGLGKEPMEGAKKPSQIAGYIVLVSRQLSSVG